MDRLKALAVFKSVAERGSFVRGAQTLGISCSVATRAVQDLEAHLHVRLLQRTTRRIALTSVGRSALAQACEVLDLLREMEQLSSLSATEAAGAVRVVAPVSYGRQLLGPALAGFRVAYPLVSVDLRLVDDCVDVINDEVDLAICVGRDLRLSLIVRKIGSTRLALYAAASYLAKSGMPEHPLDLQQHDCLICPGLHQGPSWRFTHGLTQETHAAQPKVVLSSNSVDTLTGAAIHGAGIVLLPHFLADPLVKDGLLRHVLLAWHATPLGIYLAYSSRQHQPLRVRKLIEHLCETISAMNEESSLSDDPLHPVAESKAVRLASAA